MSDAAPGGPAPEAGVSACYRHGDRRSFVRCQRCGRVICGECQTPAAVGVHCPECTASARASAPKPRSAISRAFRPGSRSPVVTYTILAITVAVFLLQQVTGGFVTQLLLYWPPLTTSEPWRMLTTALVHSERSLFHILFNMYSLAVLGPLLEGLIGRVRFLAVYLLSAFGGSLAVLYLDPAQAVVGASGAIFGMLGAFFVIQRRLGGHSMQLIVLIGINLAIGFVVPGISWQAHIGGLVVGALAALIMVRTRRVDERTKQRSLLILLAAALVLATIARFTLL
ncbi:rhomboid family intramembrane serine protease [Microcella alkalica]|uniref:rhomboid family intramembrane serine protease n=1 Tax=Microcella alkalica TaxID=355930 RepID=UPI0031DE8D80